MARCAGFAGAGLTVPNFDVTIEDCFVNAFGGFGCACLPESLTVGGHLLRINIMPCLTVEGITREAAAALCSEQWYRGKHTQYIYDAIIALQHNMTVSCCTPPSLSVKQIEQVTGALICLARHQFYESIDPLLLSDCRRVLKLFCLLGWKAWLSKIGSDKCIDL